MMSQLNAQVTNLQWTTDIGQVVVMPKDNMAHKSGYNDRRKRIHIVRKNGGSLLLTKQPANPSSSKYLYEPAERMVGRRFEQRRPECAVSERMPTAANYRFQANPASCGRTFTELAAAVHG
jgi:hypothetical protein